MSGGFGRVAQVAFDRALAANRLMGEGKTLEEIGSILGVGTGRARQLVKKGARLAEIDIWWDAKLPWSLGHLLGKAGYHSKDAVRAAILEGKLCFTPRGTSQTNLPGLGKKGLAVICQWVGCDAADAAIFDPISPEQFASAVASGMAIEDAIAQHLAGDRRTVLRILGALAALSDQDRDKVLLWAREQPRIQ